MARLDVLAPAQRGVRRYDKRSQVVGGPAIPLAVGGAGLSALGNVKGANTNVATPPDLQGARGNQINILDYLLGGAQGAQGQGGDPTGRLQNVFGQYGSPLT